MQQLATRTNTTTANDTTPDRHELRMIERRGGYTVPGTVRRNLTADQLADAERELWDTVLAPGGHAQQWGQTRHGYQIQTLTY